MSPRTPDVSVVVPIYNVEQYLRECVDSILAQTHENIEVILVNDGSTDGSLEIMREYEVSDSRVLVVDKPNGGYGHSVNRGIEAATGTWLSIIEPDDIIDVRMYADLLKNATLQDGTLADVVKSSYWLYYDHEDGTEPYTDVPNLMQYMPTDRCVLEGKNLQELLFHHPSIWSAIYRRDFIEDCQIRMIEPKGAGWADNPWFFDTILRAQSIVWWPRAYYYYRQTNPNASSKSPSMELPFDRLRDMRKIVANIDLDADENTIVPFYNRSFCYILDSVLDEYGYPESDPEVQKRIREVLESMDRKTVLKAKFGIPEAHKSYYKDVMGIHLKELPSVPKPTKPFLSVILAMDNDAQQLWPTVLSLAKQRFRNFEVLCVDTGSRNRFAEIVEDISKVDARFSLIQLGEDATVADAFNAGLAAARGVYVQFWRPGVSYPYSTDLEHIITQVREKKTYVDPRKPWHIEEKTGVLNASPFSRCPSAPDAIVTTEELLTDFLPPNADEYSDAKVACVPAEISRSLFVSLTGLTGYPWMFRRSLLTSGKLAFLEGDNNAGMFSIAALNTANLVTIVRGGSPDWEEADNLVTDQLNRDDARGKLIPFVKERITMVAAQIPELPDSASGYAALIAEFETVREMIFSKTGDRDAFDAVSALFHEHFAEADLSALPIEQFEKYEKLHRFFATDYTTALQHEVAFLKSEAYTKADIGAAAELIKMKKQLKTMKESTSFRVGKALVETANKAVPQSVRKSLKTRLS